MVFLLRIALRAAPRLKVRIGDVLIAVEGDIKNVDPLIKEAYSDFIDSGEPDIRLLLHKGIPEITHGKKIFDCPPIWTLFRNENISVVEIFEGMVGLKRTLVFSKELSTADLYFSDNSDVEANPFYGPVMELLAVHYLSGQNGVIIHSCGIKNGNRGILFVGESGAGKSTLANMWHQDKRSADILSDDRVILREDGKDFYIYGTPWHGDAKFSSCKRVKLEKIFFLNKDSKNSIKKSSERDSMLRFLTCSFPPFWESSDIKKAMDLFSRLHGKIPCYEFGFTPDKSAVEFVRNELIVNR